MKNLPTILSGAALLGVIVLFILHFSAPKSAAPAMIAPAPTAEGARGVHIAWVNADTLDAKYEWLKSQKEAINKRAEDAEKGLSAEQESLMRDFQALQEKFQTGTMTQADAEKQQSALVARRDKLADKASRLEKQLGEEQKKAFNDLYAKVEAQLKTLSSQIGYDYILSYSRGGQILLASDSLDITRQVLDLLNAQETKK